MQILADISSKLQAGKAKEVQELVQQALDQQVPVRDILEQGLLDGMGIIGAKFKNDEVFVPEVLIAARAMNRGMEVLKPYFAESGVEARGRVCIGTVQGDLHDIGKNLVKMMMEGKGFEVIDLGTDVPAEAFVKAAAEHGCAIVCLSALLTTTMPAMRQVVEAFEAAGTRDQVKIMVGGAPVTDEFCAQIGADAYAADAASAADKALALLGG
ncbi:MAG: cobalamin-binding protein [Clostridiales bacterium]|nr:cobalamin-binding protein [Clostridiales bacterium]